MLFFLASSRSLRFRLGGREVLYAVKYGVCIQGLDSLDGDVASVVLVCCRREHILRDVSGEALPGRLLAIMGPSGW